MASKCIKTHSGIRRPIFRGLCEVGGRALHKACSNLFADGVELTHETKHCRNPKGGVDPPPEARAALAGTLIDSLDETVDTDAESAWEAEIVMRLKEIDEGKVNLVPWAEARARIVGQ